jgi:hypothetical protein
VKLAHLVDKVASPWRGAFVRFVESGDADEAFLDYLDRDASAQQAVELAFGEQARALEGLAQRLRESDAPLATAGSTRPAAAQMFETLTRALETAVRLPTAERHTVIEAAIARASEGIAEKGDRAELRETLADLKHAAAVAEAAVDG